MNTKHYLKAILISAILIFTSCAPSSWSVIYSVNSITPADTLKTIPINVDIRTFKDNRTNIAENNILFISTFQNIRYVPAYIVLNDILFITPSLIEIDKKKFCINAERYYNKAPVVNQMSQIFVKHANKAQLFTNASYKESINEDYYLTGTLNSFYGKQEFSERAAEEVQTMGVLFGTIGGAIAAESVNAKTPGTIIIDISDLKLFKKDGTLVKDFGNFNR